VVWQIGQLSQYLDNAKTVELVSYLVQEEVSARDATLRETSLHKAKFPSLKTIDGFNFALQPTVDESKIRALADLDFYVLLKMFCSSQELTSQLYASFADATFQRELERLGKYLSLDKTASSHFFQVINQAYERQSVIITGNRPFQEWSGVFYDAVIVITILDRVLHHAHIFNMKGNSYKLREYMQAEEKKVMPLSQIAETRLGRDKRRWEFLVGKWILYNVS